MTATLAHPPVAPQGPAPSPHALEDLDSFRTGLLRFTSTDLRRMWEAGILPEDVSIELLDGLLFYRDASDGQGRPGVPGTEHDFVIGKLGDLAPSLKSPDRFLRVQVTLLLSDAYEPIPDAMVLRGRPDDYRARQPNPADVLCLIEVADHSYPRDAGEKRAAYAAAGIGQYIIIDLRRRLAEVYAEPDPAAGAYPPPSVVSADGSVLLRVDDSRTVAVPLAEMLP
jgi:Uma2 family endonuclease